MSLIIHVMKEKKLVLWERVDRKRQFSLDYQGKSTQLSDIIIKPKIKEVVKEGMVLETSKQRI